MSRIGTPWTCLNYVMWDLWSSRTCGSWAGASTTSFTCIVCFKSSMCSWSADYRACVAKIFRKLRKLEFCSSAKTITEPSPKLRFETDTSRFRSKTNGFNTKFWRIEEKRRKLVPKNLRYRNKTNLGNQVSWDRSETNRSTGPKRKRLEVERKPAISWNQCWESA